MIIDASKSMPIFPRQYGKTGMQIEIVKAWTESYITKKPVELEFRMTRVKIDDLEEN